MSERLGSRQCGARVNSVAVIGFERAMTSVRRALVLMLITPAVQAQNDAGWGLALDWLQTQVEEYRDRLDAAQKILRQRAAEDAALLTRLSSELPKPRAHGYGLLPKIEPDRAIEDVELHRNTFSIANLTTRASPLWRDGFQLAKQATNGADLAALVGEFERLKGHLSWVQGQISYHRYWQKAVVEHARFFELRNRMLTDASELNALVDKKGDPAEIERLRVLIEAKVAPFRKTAGLRLEVDADGWQTLAVRVVTDITDAAFLRTFQTAVDEVFNHSAAAKATRFRIALTIERIAAAQLFGEEPPARGAAIDEETHIARFAEDAMVLTTGAKSTHAFVGRYIQIGTNPMRPRELAHEFGHLLGFSDAYLRGYSGVPNSKLGCTLIEWGGLQDNLMGSPTRGRVTKGMVKRLIEAYGGR